MVSFQRVCTFNAPVSSLSISQLAWDILLKKFFFFNFYIRDRNRDFMFTSVSGIFNKTALSNLTMRRIVDEKRNAQ